MTTYALAFNLFSLAIAFACLFLALQPIHKPSPKQNMALAHSNRLYNVRAANAAYARACRNIKLIGYTPIPLQLSHIKQQLEQQNYGKTVDSILAISKHKARLAIITAKLELRGYYDSPTS